MTAGGAGVGARGLLDRCLSSSPPSDKWIILKLVVSGVLGRSSSPRLVRRSFILLVDYLQFVRHIGPNTPRIIVICAIPAIHNSRTTTNSNKAPTPDPAPDVSLSQRAQARLFIAPRQIMQLRTRLAALLQLPLKLTQKSQLRPSMPILQELRLHRGSTPRHPSVLGRTRRRGSH